MPAEVVNLRLARKRQARQAREEVAAANRALHGVPKAARFATDAERLREEKVHEGHRLETESPKPSDPA